MGSTWHLPPFIQIDQTATVVSAELVQYDWYTAQVQRRHPGLGIPADSDYAARLRGLVSAALPVRPVYLTDPNEHIEAAYVAEKRGPLYRITGPRPR